MAAIAYFDATQVEPLTDDEAPTAFAPPTAAAYPWSQSPANESDPTGDASELTPDLNQAARHLDLLDEDANEFTFQTFDDDKTRKDQRLARVLHGTLDEHARELTRLNRAGAGVFVTVNETNGRGRKKDDITRIRAVFVEDDNGDAPPLPVEPHIVIESSPGKRHSYIRVEGAPPDEFEQVQQTMVDRYGSDPNAKDRARVLRLAGFSHRKTPAHPHQVRIVHESGEQPIKWSEAKRIFPPATATLAPLHKPGTPTATPSGQGAPTAPVTASVITLPAATIEELRDALTHIPADDYTAWVGMGHALKELGAVGRELWEEWSKTSPKWQDTDRNRWAGFAGDRTGYRAVFSEAQRHGWVNPLAGSAPAQAGGFVDGFVGGMPDPAPPETKIRLCDMARLGTVELPPPAFVIYPYVPRGYVTMLGGHGGSGKSALGLVLAAHVACGRDWGPLKVTRARVLIVSYEDGEDLVFWRLANIAREYDLPFDELRASIEVMDASEADPMCYEFSDGGVRRLMPSHEGKRIQDRILEQRFDLVVIDNASDTFDGDENNRRQVRAFMKFCAACVKPHGGAVLLLAHIDKNAAKFGANKNSYSGSTGWHNSARSRIALIDNEIHHEKLNVGKALKDPISISWTELGVPIPDTGDGKSVSQSIIDHADDRALIACFQAASEAGETVPAAATGPSTFVHVLTAFPECPKPLRDDKRRFKAAILRLVRDGRVIRETYTTHHRHQRTRYVLAPETDAPVCANAEPTQH